LNLTTGLRKFFVLRHYNVSNRQWLPTSEPISYKNFHDKLYLVGSLAYYQQDLECTENQLGRKPCIGMERLEK
jgi:hypothetical protein